MTPEAALTVVSVTYDSAEIVPAMLAALPAGLPVILVDNASADVTTLAPLAERHGARLVRNHTNRGFGAACNRGAALARTEFVLFLNPDAVPRPGAIAALLRAAHMRPEAAGFSAHIVDNAGRAVFMRRSFLLPRRAWLARGAPNGDREVPVAIGAALMVRRAAFEAVGGFDERIFLYLEDEDLSLRLRAGWGPLIFVREAEVVHDGGGSSGGDAAVAAFKARHMGWSRVYAMRKHHRPLASTRTLSHAVLKLALPDTLWNARKRAKRAGFLRGALAATLGRGHQEGSPRP